MAILRIIFALLAAVCSAEDFGDEAEYFAICDAGSTGTRLYVFRLDVSASNSSSSTAKSVFVKKVKPGLSSFAKNPADAVPPLLKLLIEGSESIPKDVRSKTTLSIMGTAGMRLLDSAAQSSIWETVKAGLVKDATFPFQKAELEARTITGEDEGLWAMYNANFLTKRMTHELKSFGTDKALGLMDLGGSSTQIVIPGKGAAVEGESFGAGAFVHSYLGFGMTYIREEMHKTYAGKDEVCYMKGRIDADIFGKGEADACRKLIREMLQTQVLACQEKRDNNGPCLGDLGEEAVAVRAISGDVDFYAVAGMTYVVDFIRWWSDLFYSDHSEATAPFLNSYPRPSLAALEKAVDVLCAGDYKAVADRTADKKLAHSFTGFDNAPYRCFQANYILVLLQDKYGFASTGQTISFLLDVDGEDLEWPLGALLHRRAASGRAGKQEL